MWDLWLFRAFRLDILSLLCFLGGLHASKVSPLDCLASVQLCLQRHQFVHSPLSLVGVIQLCSSDERLLEGLLVLSNFQGFLALLFLFGLGVNLNWLVVG